MNKVKLIESKIYDNIRVTTYQSIDTGRSWTVYQTVESNVVTLDSVLKAIDEYEANRVELSDADIPF